jgi:hypothetical protein
MRFFAGRAIIPIDGSYGSRPYAVAPTWELMEHQVTMIA